MYEEFRLFILDKRYLIYMICRSWETQKDYNYKFVEDGKVELENEYDIFTVLYEDWVNEYYIIDKWNSLKIDKS